MSFALTGRAAVPCQTSGKSALSNLRALRKAGKDKHLSIKSCKGQSNRKSASVNKPCSAVVVVVMLYSHCICKNVSFCVVIVTLILIIIHADGQVNDA